MQGDAPAGALTPNPGGTSGNYSQDVVGRDEAAARCWRTLEVKSIVLASDRRMGKTWLLKKMGQEAPRDVVWLFAEVEGVATLGEFLQRLYDEAKGCLHFKSRVLKRVGALFQRIGGCQVGSFTLPKIAGAWKDVLLAMSKDLDEHGDGRRVVLVMDEFPLMLHKIARSCAEDAMELCDVLRHIRQQHRAIRMVYAGSVGLHLVLDDLRRKGYHNEPTNDMETVELPPLEDADARDLAHRLLRGAEIEDPDGSLAEAVAREGEGIPFWIHRLPFEMEKRRSKPWSAADVAPLLHSLIEDPNDPLELGRYRTRIRGYYPVREEQEAIFALLDHAAQRPDGIALRDLLDAVAPEFPEVPRSRLGELVEMLERDHYLRRRPDGARAFASRILRRWWTQLREGVA